MTQFIPYLQCNKYASSMLDIARHTIRGRTRRADWRTMFFVNFHTIFFDVEFLLKSYTTFTEVKKMKAKSCRV